MERSSRSDEKSLRDDLRIIGLSDTEINTYLALLTRGEATMSTVADDANVSQRAVYDIAERLEDRRLVRVNDHASPTTIRALPPSESISNLTERLESTTSALEERFNETEPQVPEIQMVKTYETVLKRIRGAISGAEREIIVSIPEHIYPDIETDLRAANERGVLVLVLLGDTEDPPENSDRYAGTADLVRYWGESLPFLYVADNTRAMIGDPALLSGRRTDKEAVVVSQQNLAGSILGLHLSGYWPAGTEIFVTDPDPLPETYDWFRTAYLHARLHERDGTALRADVDTVKGPQISGPVTRIKQGLVEPPTNEFTLEASLAIETDEGKVTIGGEGYFVEDYGAESIGLRSDS